VLEKPVAQIVERVRPDITRPPPRGRMQRAICLAPRQVIDERVFTPIDYFLLRPAIMLALFGCGILLVDNSFFFPTPKQRKYGPPVLAIIGLLLTASCC